MAVCAGCGSENPDDSLHCGVCGRPFSDQTSCPACGHANAAESRFCSQCGSLIPDSAGDRASSPRPASSSKTDRVEGSPGEWEELSRLVSELADESLTSQSNTAFDELTPKVPGFNAGVDSARPMTEIALADCMAGNGTGPTLTFAPVTPPQFDHDKALTHIANSLAVPRGTTKVSRKRPYWREPGNF